MYTFLWNVFEYNHFQYLSNVYHYIFLILLPYITGYTPLGLLILSLVSVVLHFIIFLKLCKLHSSFHLLKVWKLHILNA